MQVTNSDGVTQLGNLGAEARVVTAREDQAVVALVAMAQPGSLGAVILGLAPFAGSLNSENKSLVVAPNLHLNDRSLINSQKLMTSNNARINHLSHQSIS